MANRPLNIVIDWNAVFTAMAGMVLIAGMSRLLSRMIGLPAPAPRLHQAKPLLLPSTELPAARLLEKWRRAKARNSTLALKDLETLGPEYDVEECKQALLDYRDMERSDYDDQEEYQEAREEAWDAFLECLESLAGEEEEMTNSGMSQTVFLPQVLNRDGEPVPPAYRHLASWLRGPLPDYSLLTMLPAVEPEVTERKIDAVLKQLKDGVESIQQSDRFRLFLVTMSRFHDYSLGNQILIMTQQPDATRVAGFNTWKDLGRWVKKGEKGIAILAPIMPPRPTCPECGARVPKGARYCAKCGVDIRGAEIEATPVFFKVVYVFDASQTEGKELPEFAVPVLTGEANDGLFNKVMTLARTEGFTVSFESRPHQDPAVKGTYSGKSIWVRPEESGAQQLKSLLHEVAHYYSEGVFQIPRQDAETIAESAAFTVGAHFGFDSGVRSFPYVALWAKDKKMLEANLAAIRKVSSKIIDALDQTANKMVRIA